MRKLGVQFDADNNFIGDFLEGMQLPEGHFLFEGEMPQGLYGPKFIDGEVVEGKSQAEIDEIRNAPKPLTDVDILGQQLVQKDLQVLHLQSDNQTLGQQLVSMELRLLALEGRSG